MTLVVIVSATCTGHLKIIYLGVNTITMIKLCSVAMDVDVSDLMDVAKFVTEIQAYFWPSFTFNAVVCTPNRLIFYFAVGSGIQQISFDIKAR